MAKVRGLITLKHGTWSCYNNHQCRCVKCREAAQKYWQEYKAKDRCSHCGAILKGKKK